VKVVGISNHDHFRSIGTWQGKFVYMIQNFSLFSLTERKKMTYENSSSLSLY
jgi:hypothetical protein